MTETDKDILLIVMGIFTGVVFLYVLFRCVWVAAQAQGFDRGYKSACDEVRRERTQPKIKPCAVPRPATPGIDVAGILKKKFESLENNDKLWFLRQSDDLIAVPSLTDDELRSYYAVMHDGVLAAEEESFKRNLKW